MGKPLGARRAKNLPPMKEGFGREEGGKNVFILRGPLICEWGPGDYSSSKKRMSPPYSIIMTFLPTPVIGKKKGGILSLIKPTKSWTRAEPALWGEQKEGGTRRFSPP